MDKLNNTNYSLSQQASYLFTGRVVALLIQFFVPVVLVRLLPMDDYGLYRQALLVALTIIPILRFGLAESLFYFFPTAKDKVNQLLSQTLFLFFFIGLVFLSIFYFFRYPISNFFENSSFINLIYPLSLYIFFMLVSTLLEYILILERKSKMAFIYIVCNELTRTLFIISSLLVFKNIQSVIYILSLFAFLKGIILCIYFANNYQLSLKIKSWKYFHSQLRYAFPLGLARITGDIGKRADKFIISSLLPSNSYAIYSIANLRIPYINIVFASIINVILPRLSKFSKEGDDKKAIKLWHKAIITYSAIIVPSVIFFSLLASPIITLLYTENYASSVNLFRIFLFIPLVQMLSFAIILRAYNYTNFILKANLISMIVGIGIGYILIKNFGLTGGAISSVIAFASSGVIQLMKSKEVLKLSFKKFLPWKRLGIIILVSIIISITLLIVKLFNLSKIVTIVGGTIYFPIVMLVFSSYKIIEIKKIVDFVKGFFK